jgi:hypothetical protein
MPRVLTKLRITEVSAVDRGAGEGTRIILMKRHDAPTEAASRRAYFRKIFSKAEADDGGGNAGGGDITNHPVVQMARLLVASGKFGDHGQALDYLLNTPNGAALLHRTSTHKGETMRTTETVESILKDCGPVSFCKAIVDRGRAPCDEAELVAVLSRHAAEQFNMPGDRAFAKLYEAEESVRRACNIAKAMPFVADVTPVMVGGADTRDLSNESEAIAQLKQIGAQRYPSASPSTQFERALVAPENAALARRAVPRPQPTTSYPFPR